MKERADAIAVCVTESEKLMEQIGSKKVKEEQDRKSDLDRKIDRSGVSQKMCCL